MSSDSTALAPRRDVALSYVLWFGGFFMLCGLHRFYMGRWVSGLVWMATFGLCGVGQLIDLFALPRMIEDSNRGAGW